MATCLGCGKTGVSGGECPNHTFYSVSPTPEPELNVEAEIRAICRDAWLAIHEEMLAQKVNYSMGTAYSALCELRDAAHPRILALIQQVSDQRVKGFAQKLKTAKSLQGEPWSWHKSGAAHTAEGREHDKRGAKNVLREWFKTDIDQTLADYLSHKEARDGTDL